MTILSEADFGEALASFEHTAFRLELQDAYAEPCEADLLAAFQRGNALPADTVPELRAWFDQVATQVQDGKRVERVRVQQDPPTVYQRFERWIDRWNLEAGEIMRYLTVQRAHDIGLLPAAGRWDDWWLLDSGRLLIMRFDSAHRRIRNELVTEAVSVFQACKWRDLAVHHSVRAQLPDVAS